MSLATYNKIVNASRPKEESTESAVSPTQERIFFQVKADWIRNPRTQEVFQHMSKQVDDLEQQARDLALTFQQHQNPHGIIQRLIRAAELRNTIKTYGSIE